MGLVGAAISGSCGAVSQHARFMEERFFLILFLFFFNGQTTFPHERGMKRRQGADRERMHRKGCTFIWGLKQISVHFRL